MKLTEDKYNKIKLSLRLSEIGEVVRIHNVKPETIKLVNVCDTYAEYVQSLQFQDQKELEYQLPVTNNELMRELVKIREMLERMELAR